MIRGLLRLIGLFLLAGGFIALVLDGVRFIATGAWDFAAFATVAGALFPATFAAVEPAVVRHIHPLLWSYALGPLFAAPAFAVLGVLGVGLLWISRKPAPPIGFAPRG